MAATTINSTIPAVEDPTPTVMEEHTLSSGMAMMISLLARDGLKEHLGKTALKLL